MSFTVGISHGKQCDTFECPCKSIPMMLSFWTAAQLGDLQSLQLRYQRNPKLLNQTDGYGYTALHYASQNGHTKIVQYLLSCGAEVNAIECGATPLHRAAFAGHLEVVKLLIQAGSNLDYQDSSFGDMNTAAHKAILSKQFDVFDLLVKHSANLSIRNKDGLTPVELKEVIDSEVVHEQELPKTSETSSSQPAVPIALFSEVSPPSVSLISCSFCNTESFSLSRTKQGKLVCDICLKRNPTLKWK